MLPKRSTVIATGGSSLAADLSTPYTSPTGQNGPPTSPSKTTPK